MAVFAAAHGVATLPCQGFITLTVMALDSSHACAGTYHVYACEQAF